MEYSKNFENDLVGISGFVDDSGQRYYVFVCRCDGRNDENVCCACG